MRIDNSSMKKDIAVNATSFVNSLQTEKSREQGQRDADGDQPLAAPCTLLVGADDTRPEQPVSTSLLGTVELILKNRARLHALLRVPTLHRTLIPRFLAVSLAGFLLFGIGMSLVLCAAGTWPRLTAIDEYLSVNEARGYITKPLIQFSDTPGSPWLPVHALKLIVAYVVGLVAATGICLPSLYFYGLLSGVRMSMLDVTLHALKAKAISAIALVGILPIYAAIGLGMVVFGASEGLVRAALLLGLALPFIAGLWGTNSLYIGFAGLCDTLPPERRERRACFLRRLVLSWSACYSAIMPVMIYTLWESLGT